MLPFSKVTVSSISLHSNPTIDVKDTVWKFTLNNHSEIQKSILRAIQYAPKTRRVDNNTDVILSTDYYTNEQDYTQKLYARILKESLVSSGFQEKLESYYCTDSVEYGTTWFQQYEKSDTHSWHFHPDCNISIVYYVELERPEDSTEFFDLNSREPFYADVCEGDVVVFPAFLPHRSPSLKGSRKTIISWNLNFSDKNNNVNNKIPF